MLRYNEFAFASPPGTPVEWFQRIMKKAGLAPIDDGDPYAPFEKDYRGHTITLVSHPLTWIPEFYTGNEATKNPPENLAKLQNLRNKKRSRFEKFIREYLSGYKGVMSAMFSEYDAFFTQKQEDLPWSAIEFLEMIKHPNVDPSALASALRPDKPSERITDVHLRHRILEAEEDFCRHYNYF